MISTLKKESLFLKKSLDLLDIPQRIIDYIIISQKIGNKNDTCESKYSVTNLMYDSIRISKCLHN